MMYGSCGQTVIEREALSFRFIPEGGANLFGAVLRTFSADGDRMFDQRTLES